MKEFQMSNYTEYQVRVYANGDVEWRDEAGDLHREDGPAIERVDGDKFWYLNGKTHREDGPACEWENGDKEWYLNGKRHRVDGPAVERPNGIKFWYLNGAEVSEQEHAEKTKPTKELTVGEIEQLLGYKIKVVK